MPKVLQWLLGIYAVIMIAVSLPRAIREGDGWSWVITIGSVLLLVGLAVMAHEMKKRGQGRR